jgi:hypothetical protein
MRGTLQNLLGNSIAKFDYLIIHQFCGARNRILLPFPVSSVAEQDGILTSPHDLVVNAMLTLREIMLIGIQQLSCVPTFKFLSFDIGDYSMQIPFLELLR